MPSREKDPKQELLRARKKQWNQAYKRFTSKLRGLKNGINGRGDKQFNLPISNIKDPLPDQIGAFLHNVSTEFDFLVQEAGGIIDQQSGYSRNRRKKQPKKPAMPSAPQAPEPQQDKLVEQLSRLGAENSEITKEASSRFSRGWQYLKSMFYMNEVQKHRVGLLKLCANLFWKLKDFNNEILSVGLGNTPHAIGAFQESRFALNTIKIELARLEKLVGSPAQSKPTVEEQQPQESNQNISQDEIEKEAQEVSKIHSQVWWLGRRGLIAQEDATSMFHSLLEWQRAKSLEKSDKFQTVSTLYNKIVNDAFVNAERRGIKVPAERTIEALRAAMEKKANQSGNIMLTKQSHNIVSRFLKRQLLKMRPFNKTVAYRLDVASILEQIDHTLKTMMNILHSGVEIDKLKESVSILEKQFKEILQPLSIIITLYQQDIYASPEKRQKFKGREPSITDDPNLNFLLRRKMRRDLSSGLF